MTSFWATLFFLFSVAIVKDPDLLHHFDYDLKAALDI
jgi:hypothetical protein